MSQQQCSRCGRWTNGPICSSCKAGLPIPNEPPWQQLEPSKVPMVIPDGLGGHITGGPLEHLRARGGILPEKKGLKRFDG